jgi:hypothetical protein
MKVISKYFVLTLGVVFLFTACTSMNDVHPKKVKKMSSYMKKMKKLKREKRMKQKAKNKFCFKDNRSIHFKATNKCK